MLALKCVTLKVVVSVHAILHANMKYVVNVEKGIMVMNDVMIILCSKSMQHLQNIIFYRQCTI